MRTLLSVFVTAVLSMTLISCDDGPAENAGEKIDRNFEEAGENVDEAVDDAGRAVEDACEDVTDENC